MKDTVRHYCSVQTTIYHHSIVSFLTQDLGPVVRVAPNELSFNTSSSWHDIYGTRRGVKPFIKSLFYDGGNFASESLSIVSERDPKRHAEMRKYLGSAFSDRTLKAQEPLVAEIVDRFVEKLGAAGQAKEGTDVVSKQLPETVLTRLGITTPSRSLWLHCSLFCAAFEGNSFLNSLIADSQCCSVVQLDHVRHNRESRIRTGLRRCRVGHRAFLGVYRVQELTPWRHGRLFPPFSHPGHDRPETLLGSD